MRRASRKKLLLRGLMAFQQATFKAFIVTKLPCVIKDISVTGAKIDTLTIHAIPSQFILELPDHNLTIPSQVKWRRKTEIGVAFLINVTSIEKELLNNEQLTAVV